MYFLYILYSKLRDKYYVGSIGDIEGRLKSHNSNHSGFTVRTGDWLVVYHESFEKKEEAYGRERAIKKWKLEN